MHACKEQVRERDRREYMTVKIRECGWVIDACLQEAGGRKR
jgi:hypothetical protein